MLAAITAFLGAIPAFVSLIQTIWAFIQKEESLSAQKALAQKVSDAVSIAASSGDTSALENIFKSGNTNTPSS